MTQVQKKNYFSFFQMQDQLKTMFQAFVNSPTAELEVGVSMKSGCKQVVPFDIASRLCTELKLKPQIQTIRPKKWVDMFYPGNVRVRSRVGHPPECVIKTRLVDIHAKCPQRRLFSFHFTLKDEIPTTEPNGIVCEYVRLQEVHEFIYKQAFCYSIKKVQQGATKEDAAQGDINFELEIEIIRNSPYLASHSLEEMSESLILKALDFIRERPDEKLTLELNLLPKSLRRLEEERPKRKYVSKKAKKEMQEPEN
jgi:hypothetical protein